MSKTSPKSAKTSKTSKAVKTTTRQRLKPSQLRSRAWFDNPANADMTALYLERTMNYGLSFDELQSGRPVIGIAQSGSDISPCNRHHLVLAERIRAAVEEEVFEHAGARVPVTVSVGAALMIPQRGDGDLEARLVESADAAMYEIRRDRRQSATDHTPQI